MHKVLSIFRKFKSKKIPFGLSRHRGDDIVKFMPILMYVEWILSFHLRLDPSDGSFLPISRPETCKNFSPLQCVSYQLTRIHGTKYK